MAFFHYCHRLARVLVFSGQEYFLSEDVGEVLRSVKELESPAYHYEIVKRGINMSLDAKDHEVRIYEISYVTPPYRRRKNVVCSTWWYRIWDGNVERLDVFVVANVPYTAMRSCSVSWYRSCCRRPTRMCCRAGRCARASSACSR